MTENYEVCFNKEVYNYKVYSLKQKKAFYKLSTTTSYLKSLKTIITHMYKK